jgi:hypothetical protein
MKCLVLPILTLTAISAMAQPGDFALKSSQQRLHKTTSASTSFRETFANHVLLGTNYRSEWRSSVTVPVLNLKTDFNGLTPEKEGGGKETHTLHLKDKDGNHWVLRSVEKFPGKVVPPPIKGTVAEYIVRDGVSGSYPYSVLSVGTIAKAAGVPYFPNTLVYIPDDPLLGKFRDKFKNTLAFLELRTWKNNNGKEALETDSVIHEVQKSGNHKVDQQAVLKARLLDNFIMDFDRHDSQWDWAQKDSVGMTWYYPLPKDRDQAFFKADGLVPKILSHRVETGLLQGLRAKAKNIRTFNYSEAAFDRTFLSELDETDWNNAIKQFLSVMTNSVIENALHKQPKEIQAYHAQQIIDVLEKKRTFFESDMMEYYRFLSRTVSVVGSNDPEVFTITKHSDGSVIVQVQNAKTLRTTYIRSFNPSVTKEIRVYGLGGNDKFLVSGKGSPIKIRMIGGSGNDYFSNDAGSGKVIAYDMSSENNKITGRGIINHISNDTTNNKYNRTANEYNSHSFGIQPEFSLDGGFYIGPSYKIITRGFRKEPYASMHKLFVTKLIGGDSWHFHYDGEFMRVAEKTDIILEGDALLPTTRTRFFGWGNTTVFDKSKGLAYYKVLYNMTEASVRARYWVTPALQLQYGPLLQNFNVFKPGDNEKYLVALYPSQSNNTIYDRKWYAGGEFRAVFNTKNDELIPLRGIYATVYSRNLAGISKSTSKLNQVGAVLSLYTDALYEKHVILATTFGYHTTMGDLELPQAQYLGFKQDLRGYRYQRFGGTSRAYNNTEVRVNFGDANFYIFKGPIGILAFHDIGRVWIKTDRSNNIWHTGYGGGIWLAPYNKIVLVASLTSSKEEPLLPMGTIGFQF